MQGEKLDQKVAAATGLMNLSRSLRLVPPLPGGERRGEGGPSTLLPNHQTAAFANATSECSLDPRMFSLSPPEKRDVSAVVPSDPTFSPRRYPQKTSRHSLFGATVLVLTLLTSLGFVPSAARADDEPPKKALVLPKSPRAAAYMLGRLSNKELIETPRSEFVYVALLEREGIDRRYRFEALEGLVKIRNSDPVTELIKAVQDLDQKGEESEPVLRDLAAILLQHKPGDLDARRGDLEKLTGESQLPLSRQIGYGALATADGSALKTWQSVESAPAKLADLLLSIPLIHDAGLRSAFHPKIEPLLHKSEPVEVRRAAIAAIAAVPGHDTGTFQTLAELVKSGTERAAAVAALEQIPRKSWPKEQAEALTESLVTWLRTLPVDQRTEPAAVSAFQLTTELASLLPPEKARNAGRTLRSLGASVFVIHTIPEQMLYDRTLLVVEPGKPVEIILKNDDAMQHNLVVVAPGGLEEIGVAAEKMAPQPDAFLRFYVPDSPKVLFATKLLDPGQQVKLAFTAPTQPGDYPYLCTYPGHWRRMVGTLAVATDVEAYLASHAEAAQPKMTEWKLEDLAPDLARMGAGHDPGDGRQLFTKLACAQCHKLGAEGYAYGPDLSDVFKRYNNDRAEVLRQVLEPSLVIADRYRIYQFELQNGDELSGMIVKEDTDTATIQTGPSDALIQTLKKPEIKERKPQSSSMMPVGLLNALTKEQIFDLLAYLESGGDLSAHQHKQ